MGVINSHSPTLPTDKPLGSFAAESSTNNNTANKSESNTEKLTMKDHLCNIGNALFACTVLSPVMFLKSITNELKNCETTLGKVATLANLLFVAPIFMHVVEGYYLDKNQVKEAKPQKAANAKNNTQNANPLNRKTATEASNNTKKTIRSTVTASEKGTKRTPVDPPGIKFERYDDEATHEPRTLGNANNQLKSLSAPQMLPLSLIERDTRNNESRIVPSPFRTCLFND